MKARPRRFFKPHTSFKSDRPFRSTSFIGGTLGCGKLRRNPVYESANLVEVTTKEGVVGEDRVAVIAGSPVFLPVVMR